MEKISTDSILTKYLATEEIITLFAYGTAVDTPYKVISHDEDIKSKCHISHISRTNDFFGKIMVQLLYQFLKLI